MKRYSVLFMLSLFGIISFAKDGRDYKKYFRTDSAYIFSWDVASGIWNLSSVQTYYYNPEGMFTTVIERSIATGMNTGKTEVIYNDLNLASEQTSFSWNGIWNPVVRNLISYDESGKTSEIMVQVYSNGLWVNNRWQKNYKYDDSGSLLEFQMYYWRNNGWSDPTTDYSTYDLEGKLIKRQALYSNGTTDYLITYSYDSTGLRSESYAKYPSGSDWLNWWLISYQYNDCGTQTSQVQFKGVITNWIPQTKTVLFNSFNTKAYPEKKVPVCHNGHTLYVSKNAVKEHLAHGDCIGECTVEKHDRCDDNRRGDKNIKPPFTIYPNPATDRFTLKFDKGDNHDYEQRRVELTDFYGKLIKSFNIKGDGDLTINRDGLPSGKYYIRLSGEEGFSSIIIFE